MIVIIIIIIIINNNNTIYYIYHQQMMASGRAQGSLRLWVKPAATKPEGLKRRRRMEAHDVQIEVLRRRQDLIPLSLL